MPQKASCLCGTCRLCRRRENQRIDRFLTSHPDVEDFYNLSHSPESCLNLFVLSDLYYGTIPKNGRVLPKRALQ